jgi:electron transfer flavoprotein alpha subunit
VANILVFIEMAGDRPAPASLETLGEGRRMASFVGATLHAALPCAKPASFGDDDPIAVLGRHGADKILLVGGPPADAPLAHATHGGALAAACDSVSPSIVLLAATPGGRDVAPRLAARLGAAFVPEPSVEYGPRGDLVMSRTVYGGQFRRRLAADEVERPIVATLTPGSYVASAGDEEAEVAVLPDAAPGTGVEEVARKVDPGAPLESARVIVCAGAGVNAEAYALARELAGLLGGEVGVTREAVAAGLDGPDREIGIGGRCVHPRLYLACGASGSSAHLAAISADAEIVAINKDADAPIFRVASYGMVGDAAEILRGLIKSVKVKGG